LPRGMSKRWAPKASRDRREPMAEKGNDPLGLWQKTIGEMEKKLNAFANEAMTSPEFSKLMNNAGGIAAGTQKQIGEFMGKYLLMMNLSTFSILFRIA
jgi:hypothetical protein